MRNQRFANISSVTALGMYFIIMEITYILFTDFIKFCRRISVYDLIHLFTGQPLNMSISGRNIDLNWAPVFSNDHDMTTVFDVTIGSTKGSADIIDKRNLETSQMSVSVPKSNVGSENIQELFISVSCWHSTGLKTTYKTNFKLPF